jgi:hypothetical protein
LDAVAGKWKEKGLLIPNSQGRNIHNTRINGTKANCYKISLIEDETCMIEADMNVEVPF